MRILVINANTSEAMTDLVVAEARRIASPGTELIGVTGRFGACYIATRTAYAIAGHAALDAYVEHWANADAVILACFGDPGLRALQEIATVPVIGMAEAACRAAAARGKRFPIVTGGERWLAMLQEYVAGIGLGDRLASIRVVERNGAQIAADPEGSLASLAEACRVTAAEGADVVTLAGAGLVGLAARIADRIPIPIVDALVESVKAAEAAVLIRPPVPAGFGGPVQTVGLASPLSTLMLGKRFEEVA
jgi:allantoin racemase